MSRSGQGGSGEGEIIKPWIAKKSPYAARRDPDDEERVEPIHMSGQQLLFAMGLLVYLGDLEDGELEHANDTFPQFDSSRIENALQRIGVSFNVPGLGNSHRTEFGYRLMGQIQLFKTDSNQLSRDSIAVFDIMDPNDLSGDDKEILKAIAEGKLTIYDVRKE